MMLEEALIVRNRLRAEASAARAREMKMIAEAARDKVSMPEHAWQARHFAEERLRAADRLVEALRP